MRSPSSERARSRKRAGTLRRGRLIAIVGLMTLVVPVGMIAVGGYLSQAEASPEPHPTPTLPGLFEPSPSPSSSPSPSPAPTPEPSRKPTRESNSGGGAGDRDRSSSPKAGGSEQRDKRDARRSRRRARRLRRQAILAYHYVGPIHSTSGLSAAEGRLLELGMKAGRARRLAYRPFIVTGTATWSNTWGAPRFGPGKKQIRRHRGQDVFCEAGARVLAAQAGRVRFGTSPLGGRVARLFRPDGSYWYYAHLAGWNQEIGMRGGPVSAGDVIGYCGRSGNAHATPPHVHFGYYLTDGSAADPYSYLTAWATRADARSSRVVARIEASGAGGRVLSSYRTPGGELVDPGRGEAQIPLSDPRSAAFLPEALFLLLGAFIVSEGCRPRLEGPDPIGSRPLLAAFAASGRRAFARIELT